MNQKTSKINNIIVLVVIVLLVLVVALVNNAYHGNTKLLNSILLYMAGAVAWGLINAFVHEFGHIIAGNKNGFKTLSLNVWFFRWTRTRNGFAFSFIMMGDEAGYTESVPTFTENMPKRLKKTALGGIVASGVLTVLSVIPLFFCNNMQYQLYCLLAIALPVSGYYFIGNLLPIISDGVKNDGAIIYGINNNDNELKVLCSVLCIQSELYNGKTPSEIDKKYYFDLPQLAEDSREFCMLMNLRFAYFVDKSDFENAKKICDRMIQIVDDLPKENALAVRLDALYASCTFDFNEEKADALMYEVDKEVNSRNSATNLRLKMAYMLFIKKERRYFEDFYNKAIKMAAKEIVLGVAIYEKKLLDKMKHEFYL